jgi:hypothetical protein
MGYWNRLDRNQNSSKNQRDGAISTKQQRIVVNRHEERGVLE